ncbi:MAG: hypothetical protein H5T84_02350, partial [Thermoleophilia bacterium]|nr:hypothetical protein [Thermoleophilia bacterium]
AGRPLYVVAVDAAERRVVVGDAEELRVAEVQICNLTWHRVPVEQGAGGAVQGQLQFRSTGEARAARLLLSERASGGAPLPETPSERATVIFDEPAYAVAPGQTAVFYVGDEVVVAGTIDAALPPENSVA